MPTEGALDALFGTYAIGSPLQFLELSRILGKYLFIYSCSCSQRHLILSEFPQDPAQGTYEVCDDTSMGSDKEGKGCAWEPENHLLTYWPGDE